MELIDMFSSKDEDLKKIKRMIEQGEDRQVFVKMTKKQSKQYMEHLRDIIKKQNNNIPTSSHLITFKINGVIIGFTLINALGEDLVSNGKPSMEIKLFSILEKFQRKGHSRTALSMIIDGYGKYNLKVICFYSASVMMHILEREGFKEKSISPSGTRTFLRVAE